jgi:hypothetical protein
VLADGRYDAFVVWADMVEHAHDERVETGVAARDDERNDRLDAPRIAFSLTITSGIHKGEVVDVVASNLRVRDPIDLVGLPCTLVVEGGTPHVET